MLFSMFVTQNCTHNWTFYEPQHTNHSQFSHLARFRYNESSAYLIGSFTNASAISTELYSEMITPTKRDVMIILFGAHAHATYKADFYHFLKDLYDNLATPFPGHTFWYEPFPQHFSTGEYISQDTEGSQCKPITHSTNQSQFWRVDIYNKIVKETYKVHRVKAYNFMAPYWWAHHSLQTWSNMREKYGNITGKHKLYSNYFIIIT